MHVEDGPADPAPNEPVGGGRNASAVGGRPEADAHSHAADSHSGHSHSGHSHSGHSHWGHHHGLHAHAPKNLNWSFAIAIILNIGLVVGEVIGGWLAGSMALLADAGHNLGDVAGLIVAWWAHWLRDKGTGERWTYGFRAFTILAANINGVMIVAAIIGVGFESIRRLFVPTEVAEVPVLWVALFAAVLNFATAKLLSSNQEDLNVRGAYFHMLADAAVSLAVVLGALVMLVSGWQWVDPAISLGICVVLSLGTWQLLRESTSMMLHAAPQELNLGEIRAFLLGQAKVTQVLDLHVWSVSTTDVLLTARICCPEAEAMEQDVQLRQLHHDLKHTFGIRHATLEIVRECDDSQLCSLVRED